MTCYECAKDLYDKMGQGQMIDAFEKYYADDVVVVEKATGETRNGKDAQRQALNQWVNMQQEFHGGGYTAITANEDSKTTMVETWVDVTFKDGNRVKMEEVAVQKWNDNGQIVNETFYYNMPGGGQQQS